MKVENSPPGTLTLNAALSKYGRSQRITPHVGSLHNILDILPPTGGKSHRDERRGESGVDYCTRLMTVWGQWHNRRVGNKCVWESEIKTMKRGFPTLWGFSARVHVHRADTADVPKLSFFVFTVCKQGEVEVLRLKWVCDWDKCMTADSWLTAGDSGVPPLSLTRYITGIN